MDMSVPFRAGNEEDLAEEFIKTAEEDLLRLEASDLTDPAALAEENVLAVHFADPGAQGDPGAVEILYLSQKGVRILYGNYAFGKLDLDAVLQKLPMLKSLDGRGGKRPYPMGGKLEIPEGWGYVYMGAFHHLFVRDAVCDRTSTFLRLLLHDHRSWQLFDAVAWACGANG